MKYFSVMGKNKRIVVAPFAGAWIEIQQISIWYMRTAVAPFAGAWIEIPYTNVIIYLPYVAPFAGAWIEISHIVYPFNVFIGRSLRGSVD